MACAELTLWATFCGASPLPYRLVITPIGDTAVDGAIADTSLLAKLREEVPVGPLALITRAESDAARFDTILRSFGHYDAHIDVRIAGRTTDDPGLLPLLEGLPPASPVPVEVSLSPGPLYRLGTVRLAGLVTEDAQAAFRLTPGEPITTSWRRTSPPAAAGLVSRCARPPADSCSPWPGRPA